MPWTPARAARQTIEWGHAVANWLTTDQAALMRYMPEQMQALQWWKATGGAAGTDIADVMPSWLEARYGIATSIAVNDGNGLSPTAQRVQQLCVQQSQNIRHARLMTVTPHAQAAIGALVDTDQYRGPDPTALATLPGNGLLVLSHPLPRSGTVTGPSLVGETTARPPLRAIAWWRGEIAGTPVVRVLALDDMSGQWGRTGDAAFDTQVREQLAIANQQLPPLMPDGESLHAHSEPRPQEQSRAALAAAGRERAEQQGIPWSPDSVVDDEEGLLAARVLSVLADALAAPLLGLADELVRTPGAAQNPSAPNRTSVTICQEPDQSPH